jgi:hypothetical protein
MLYDKNDAQLLLIACQKAAMAKSIDAKECSSQILKLAAIAKIFHIPAWSVLAYKTQWGEQIDDLTPFFPEPIESVTFSAANQREATLAACLNTFKNQTNHPNPNAR